MPHTTEAKVVFIKLDKHDLRVLDEDGTVETVCPYTDKRIVMRNDVTGSGDEKATPVVRPDKLRDGHTSLYTSAHPDEDIHIVIRSTYEVRRANL